MVKSESDFWDFIIIILIFVFVIYLFLSIVLTNSKNNKFCEDNGYFASSDHDDVSIVCYKYGNVTGLDEEGKFKKERIYEIIKR